MAAWFELSKSSDGQFRFVLKADGEHTLLTSELYKAKASAENGIASVRTHGATDERYEEKTAANGKFYFNLKSSNGQVIGTSPMYADEAARSVAKVTIKAEAGAAALKDLTA